MTSLYTGYRNVYQPQFNLQQESKEREEKVREQEIRNSKTPHVAPDETAEDMNTFLEKLQKNRKNLQQNTAGRQQMQDEIAKRKLMLSNAIQMNKLALYESNNQLVKQEIKGLVQQLAKLLAAQSDLEETQNKALDSSSSLAISAAVKKAILKQQAMLTPFITKQVQETAPLTAEVATQEATESVTNPLLRSAPTEAAESTTQAKSNGAATYADDITNIGQHSMTPEEKFWHEISLIFANHMGNLQNDLQEIYEEMNSLINDPSISKEQMISRLESLDKKYYTIKSYLFYRVDLPDSVDSKQFEKLLDSLGFEYHKNESGSIDINFLGDGWFNSKTALAMNSIMNAGVLASRLKNGIISVGDAKYTLKNEVMPRFSYLLQGDAEFNVILESIRNYLNANYPIAEFPPVDGSTLSGWLDGMLPGFDSIDKSNLNFYKSVIALITAWQKKINEFNTRYAEVLKGSSGIDQSDGKHRFDADAVDKMLAMLDDISAMEHSMALILGGVTDDDLANLLEGTGINCTEMVGTVALLDIGKDVAKMLKDAIGNCFNTTIDNGEKYVVTPEQLTHFNTVLTQAQNQFDSVVKKVNTKTDSAKSLFNDTREALSNMLKTAETLLADLAKMLR